MFGLAPSAMEEGGEGPPSPPQELEELEHWTYRYVVLWHHMYYVEFKYMKNVFDL